MTHVQPLNLSMYAKLMCMHMILGMYTYILSRLNIFHALPVTSVVYLIYLLESHKCIPLC